MVTKLYAKSVDIEIIFTRVGNEKWEAIIPSDAKGQYYLDIYAEDEAGNITFMSKSLFEVDPFNLCYKLSLIDDDVSLSRGISDYVFVCKEVKCL